MTRLPAWVYGQGDEPDPRFTLANERTFLAWVRTSLALSASGVAVEAFGLPIQPGFRLATSLFLIGAGLIIPLVAWWGWARAERAMRQRQPLPRQYATLPLALGLLFVGAMWLCGILLA
jgi:putative membrane protein